MIFRQIIIKLTISLMLLLLSNGGGIATSKAFAATKVATLPKFLAKNPESASNFVKARLKYQQAEAIFQKEKLNVMYKYKEQLKGFKDEAAAKKKEFSGKFDALKEEQKKAKKARSDEIKAVGQDYIQEINQAPRQDMFDIPDRLIAGFRAYWNYNKGLVSAKLEYRSTSKKINVKKKKRNREKKNELRGIAEDRAEVKKQMKEEIEKHRLILKEERRAWVRAQHEILKELPWQERLRYWFLPNTLWRMEKPKEAIAHYKEGLKAKITKHMPSAEKRKIKKELQLERRIESLDHYIEQWGFVPKDTERKAKELLKAKAPKKESKELRAPEAPPKKATPASEPPPPKADKPLKTEESFVEDEPLDLVKVD